MKKIKAIVIVGLFVFISCGGESDTYEIPQVTSPYSASDLTSQADAILRKGLADHQQRTQALFLYNQAETLNSPQDPTYSQIKSRIELGKGLIYFYDVFEVLPALLNMIGLDINSLLSDMGQSGSPLLGNTPNGTGYIKAKQMLSSARLTCNAADFRDYLPTIDLLASNMLVQSIEHLKNAVRENSHVSLLVENGSLVLASDNPLTPEDESIILDFSGEIDNGDIGVMSGMLEILMAVVKILTSYDGFLQALVNPALNPTCSPVPGTPDWEDIFGVYGTLNADGGLERMTEAGLALQSAFSSISNSFSFIASETDDQSDDIIAYLDCGLDGKCDGDEGYPGPDEGEGNGVYDPGEMWGMASVGKILEGLLGSSPLISQLSKLLNLNLLSNLMMAMAQSVASSAPVDLVQLLLKPLLPALGMSATDQELYAMGFPALNLGAPFNPPWESIAMLEPLKDANGESIVESETGIGDQSHTWPAPFVREDPPNGIEDPAYSFYPDTDEAGNTIGVMGGLLLMPITTPDDFDADGNLIGEVDYEPMTNPVFNRIITILNALLGML